jgi:hypothetical protein
MRFKNLTWFYDFIQFLYSIRKHYTKNKYFPKHILFTMIYLIQEQNLNPRNYPKQKINMVNFIQANEDDMNMSAKIQY